MRHLLLASVLCAGIWSGAAHAEDCSTASEDEVRQTIDGAMPVHVVGIELSHRDNQCLAHVRLSNGEEQYWSVQVRDQSHQHAVVLQGVPIALRSLAQLPAG